MVPNVTQKIVKKYGSNRLRIAPRVLNIYKFVWTPPPRKEKKTLVSPPPPPARRKKY